MNWRRLYPEYDPDIIGRNLLVKRVAYDGKSPSFFCGKVAKRKDGSLYLTNNGAYHYFRKDKIYYYVVIDEIK